jgi:hypothetical protein
LSAQYIAGMLYLDTPHFFTKLQNHSKIIFPTYVAITLSILFGLCIAIAIVCTSVVNNSSIYLRGSTYERHEGLKIVMFVVLFIEKFFGYTTVFINASIFFIMMTYHKNKLIIFKDNMYEFSMSSSGLTQKLNTIILQFVHLKEEHGDTVKALSPFFAILNACGIICMYALSELIIRNDSEYIDYVNMSIFLAIETIYILSSQKVSSTLKKITNIVNSPIYIDSCIRKNINDKYIPLFSDVITPDSYCAHMRDVSQLSTQSFVTIVELSEMVYWQTLKTLTLEEWDCFTIFGLIKLRHESAIHKIFGVIFALLVSSNIISNLQQ